MKKIFAGIIIPLLIISFSFLSSCKGRSTSKQQKETEKEQVKEIQGQIETHVYPLPTSAEVIKMLTDLEVGYIIGISNPVENSKKYFSSQSRAINLGVYGADLVMQHSIISSRRLSIISMPSGLLQMNSICQKYIMKICIIK
jgi:hypothetical protein